MDIKLPKGLKHDSNWLTLPRLIHTHEQLRGDPFYIVFSIKSCILCVRCLKLWLASCDFNKSKRFV